MKPVVKILVSCPNPAWIDACTWVFPTLRVGFPTAKIDVEFNAHLSGRKDVNDKIASSPKLVPSVECQFLDKEIHHADWIREKIEQHDSDAPLVILDADTYFHEPVEDWKFNTLMAGYFVPEMYNDFAQCNSVSRLHTSFLWFQDVKALKKEIRVAYPQAYDATGAYSPCDPFMPSVKFVAGRKVFWDTTANLFQMLAGRVPFTAFGADQTRCYEHLNSAAFFDVMKERLPDGANFEKLHREWMKDPAFLKGKLWPTVAEYYRVKALEGRARSQAAQ